MNYESFEKYIDNLYTKFINDIRPSGDGNSVSELDEDFEAEVERIYAENISLMRKAKSKKRKKSKKHKRGKNTKRKKKKTKRKKKRKSKQRLKRKRKKSKMR